MSNIAEDPTMTTITTDGRLSTVPARKSAPKSTLMHRWLSCALIASAVSFAGVTTAAAQAGSTGGSIGKQEKSVSGAAAPEASQPPKSRKENRKENRREERSRHASTSSSDHSGCRSIAGTWTSWASKLYGRNDTRFNADGTLWHKSSRGTWTCNGGIYHHTWDSFGVRGPYKLSADGRRLIKMSDGSISFSR
jgi:hypothetical protein